MLNVLAVSFLHCIDRYYMNIFFSSDHHFWHEKILTFKNYDGTQVRTFDNVNHMHEYMIYKHNLKVKPTDKVYFLGDFSMSDKATALDVLHRMNGEKILIKGNHDQCKMSHYMQHFKDVRACHQFDGLILTHIPIHVDCLGRWGCNVHGHLHNNEIKHPKWPGMPDPRYLGVAMELPWINYSPISLEDAKKEIKNRLERYPV